MLRDSEAFDKARGGERHRKCHPYHIRVSSLSGFRENAIGLPNCHIPLQNSQKTRGGTPAVNHQDYALRSETARATSLVAIFSQPCRASSSTKAGVGYFFVEFSGHVSVDCFVLSVGELAGFPVRLGGQFARCC